MFRRYRWRAFLYKNPKSNDQCRPGNAGYESSYSSGTVYWFRFEPLNGKAISDDGIYLCGNLIDAQPFTLRVTLMKIAVRIVHSARYVFFKLCSHCPFEAQYRQTLHNIYRLQPLLFSLYWSSGNAVHLDNSTIPLALQGSSAPFWVETDPAKPGTRL